MSVGIERDVDMCAAAIFIVDAIAARIGIFAGLFPLRTTRRCDRLSIKRLGETTDAAAGVQANPQRGGLGNSPDRQQPIDGFLSLRLADSNNSLSAIG